MKKILVLSLSVFCFTCVNAQRFDNVQIKTTKVTDGIYMLEGSGGNIGIFTGDEATLMIDDQFAPLSDKIKAAVNEISKHKVKYLVNTHWHGDHTGGNENFGKDGAIIVGHENVKKRMSTDQFSKAFNRTTKASPKVAWPQLTFTKDMMIHINDAPVSMIHVDHAHTDGDAFVFFPAHNVIHMGDCFFAGRFPYIDLGSGGTIAGVQRALSVALSLCNDETKIIPGHGPLAAKSDLSAYAKMFDFVVSNVTQAIKDGKSLEEMKDGSMIAGYESWGEGFINGERIVDIIHTDLTRDQE